jgi:hypothetical protein
MPAPEMPTELPFKQVPDNVNKIKEWLLGKYAVSMFNKCSHQPLPLMLTEPISIQLVADARPVAANTASTIPFHLRDEVKAQLEVDVRLGVIERVPIGVPTIWQARMHAVIRPNSEPRRTVNLRQLNTHCLRETEHIVPPYQQARLILPET